MSETAKKSRQPLILICLIIAGLVLINMAVFLSWDTQFIGRHVSRRTFDWWLFQWNTSYWPKQYSWALWMLAIGLIVELVFAVRSKKTASKSLAITVEQTSQCPSQPKRRFSILLLSTVILVVFTIFLLNTDWIAKQRTAVFQILSTFFNDYFYIPLTEFMVTQTISGRLLIGLSTIMLFFVFLLLLPKIYRKTLSACQQIRQCFTRRIVLCFAAIILLLSAFLYFDIFAWLRGITLGNLHTMVQKYYFLPLTEFIATGVFTVTLLIPIFTIIVIFGLLFTLKSFVSGKTATKSSNMPEEKKPHG